MRLPQQARPALHVLALLLLLLCSAPLKAAPIPARVEAARTPPAPLQQASDTTRYDDFEDENPAWIEFLPKDPEDGYFAHQDGVLVGQITDNSALMLAWPQWRPEGDFALQVDARHISLNRSTFNTLGLAFGGTDGWKEFYALVLAEGAPQHYWAVVRYENTRVTYLTHAYRVAPGFVQPRDGWNRLTVQSIGNEIHVYCNYQKLHDEPIPYKPGEYGPNRLVGLIVASYEFDHGTIEFDNYRLSPDPAPPDPSRLYLPALSTRWSGDYAHPCDETNQYCEPNNSHDAAYGPLGPGWPYSAYPDDEDDYYAFVLDEPRTVTVELHAYAAEGDLLLYQRAETGDRVQIDQWGTGGSEMVLSAAMLPAGEYDVRVYTATGHSSTELYTLVVSY
jgi:hypothetical protein